MTARKREILIIPDFNQDTSIGQLRINDLIRQSDLMTESLTELRSEGYKLVTLEMIIKRSEARNRVFIEGFNPSLFLYTGKRVIPSEESFFGWYQETPEGQRNRDRVERYCPGSFGKFAKFEIKL